MIGSGIFLVPTKMTAAVGSPKMVFAVWIFGGILTLFGALTYAELSSMLPGAGGEYVYLNAAYGPFFGFIYGWTQTWVAKAASLATLGTGFFTYLSNFIPALKTVCYTVPLPIGPGWHPLEIRYGQLLTIGVLVFLAGVNYVGVRTSGNVQVAITALKIAMIVGVIVAGLTSTHATTANFHTSVPASPGGVAGFFAALVSALWAYDGWNNAGMIGSEVKNPERNLPLGLIGGVLAVMSIYLLTNVAYFLVLSAPEIASQDSKLTGVAAVMMRHVMGSPGVALVSIAAMISIFAAMNGSILSGSRVPYAMARDGYFFRSIAHVHPRFHTPSAAIVMLAVTSSLVLLTGQYDELATLVIFPSWILYGMSAAAVIVLRAKRPDLPRPYRVMGYPVVPILFVFVAALLLYRTLLDSPRESGIGLILIAAGLPFYFYWKGKIKPFGAAR